MNSPLIAPFRQTLQAPGLPLATVPEAWIQNQDELFTVVRGGVFGSTAFSPGDVILCRGEAKTLDEAVLIPLGRGTPRLGTVHDAYLAGAHGEPCHPARWRVSGRVHTVFPAASECRLATPAQQITNRTSYVRDSTSCPGAATVRQMSLFTEAA